MCRAEQEPLDRTGAAAADEMLGDEQPGELLYDSFLHGAVLKLCQRVLGFDEESHAVEVARHWLADHPAIDGERIGIMGQSYGGFMVMSAITEYPELWRAAVPAGASIPTGARVRVKKVRGLTLEVEPVESHG